MSEMSNKEKAIAYCEKHGIFPHKITNQTLTYYAYYPAYIAEKRRTYKVTVRLADMRETRILLKKYVRLGQENIYK